MTPTEEELTGNDSVLPPFTKTTNSLPAPAPMVPPPLVTVAVPAAVAMIPLTVKLNEPIASVFAVEIFSVFALSDSARLIFAPIVQMPDADGTVMGQGPG